MRIKMAEKKKLPDLRREAESRLSCTPPVIAERPAEELLHELQVYQIELEMQNEELRQAHLALEESRDRYLDLYEFAPIGYLTLTREGMVSEANLTCADLLGVERKKLLHRSFTRFVTPEDSDRWRMQFMSTAQCGEKQNFELALKRDDGAIFHAHLDILGRKTRDDTPLICLTIFDISERKLAEEELRIAAIAFESQQGMMVTDSHGIIVRVNQAFTRLTGYSPEEALGQTPSLLKSGRQNQAFYQTMWENLGQRGYWQGQIWNRRKNGKIYAEWLTISAVTAPNGRISHYVGTFSDITQNQEAEAEIHRLAYYDPLTQLPNRRLLQDRLSQALAASSRNSRCGAILFLDMDNFKVLNDTRGHDVGDLLLIEVAQRLHTCVRGGDTVARLGGDEFVVLLEDLSEEAEEAAAKSKQVGDKVQAAISRPFNLKGHEYHCSTSIGIGLFHNGDVTIDELLKHADLAMYQSKNAGRNTLRFFDPAMQAALDERSELEADLRNALKYRQLQLYYQPQVEGALGVASAEALLRWLHPKRGLVSPGDFIPLAEETGLILPIGHWVLETACAQIKRWEGKPDSHKLKLAVNVSARQFRQPDFVAQVRQVLASSGINPASLKIELTESLVLDNVNDTITKMQALKAIGIGFSMDDFGTGYSSLSYLTRLPLDQLKIDQSFVSAIGTDSNGDVIVQTIITMGRTLGLNVIAEGVETKAQRDFLEQNGCHAYQGFYFSRPVPVDEFELFIKDAPYT
jgi:diguanylate cyclase (GGDEF)-like protein/PAS domain S-box-containing protein